MTTLLGMREGDAVICGHAHGDQMQEEQLNVYESWYFCNQQWPTECFQTVPTFFLVLGTLKKPNARCIAKG